MRIVLLTFDTALTQPQVDNMRAEAQRQMGGDYIVIALPRGVSMTMVDEPGEYMTRCAAGVKAFADTMQVEVAGDVETNEIARRARPGVPYPHLWMRKPVIPHALRGAIMVADGLERAVPWEMLDEAQQRGRTPEPATLLKSNT